MGGSENRCWYRITVTARVGADEQITGRVFDVIEPVLVRADPHVKFRARQLKATTGEVKGAVALMTGKKGADQNRKR